MKEQKFAETINTELKIDMFSNTRKLEYVDARSLYCYILRKDFNYKLYEIRDIFIRNGKKSHHTSVLHLVNLYDEVSKRRPEIARLRNDILMELSPKVVTINLIKQCDNINKLNRIYNILIE